MEPRIDPLTPRHGITSVSAERRQRDGAKQAFEEALEKQRKDAKDQPPPEDRGDGDVVTLSHPSPPRPDAPLQGEPSSGRKDGEDDRPHVDVVV